MKNNHIFPFLWMRGEDEQVMRTEMAKINECGIGAVCVEARPHDQFCKEGWWHDMDIILDEAKKRDMKVWILDDKHFPTGYANGLIQEKYPERKKLYLAYSKASVHGYPGRLLSLDIRRMLKPAIGFWEIEGALKNMEERAKNKMLSVIAVRNGEGKKLHEEVIDLTDTVKDDAAEFTLGAGAWTVYVLFKTRTDGGNEDYINMIDRESAHTQIEGVYEAHYQHYADEFGKTIAGFFSDEPQFGNINEVCYDAALGKKKMHLPWCDELEDMLKKRFGEAYTEYLPFLFFDTEEEEKRDQIRYAYMDCVSRLYKKNFSDPIGDWCQEHGVEYIGHVVEDNGTHSRLGMGAAHFFRALSGQHMAGIDDIGQQVEFGNPVSERPGLGELGGDGEFYHYTLGKLGASAGHLDPKKKGRIMCELFGAYGWNFGVRDQKYVLDHLLVKGVNELVPHAFSMAEYPDADCPPHFYARGNNPEFPYFARLMKYANRMCEVLSNGKHVANAAVLYDGEADWVGGAMQMQKVIRPLLENQIDLEIVPMDYLEQPELVNGEIGAVNGQNEKDKSVKIVLNGISMDLLIIPDTHAIPAHFAKWIVKAAEKGVEIVFAKDYPDGIIESEEDKAEVSLDQVKAAAKACPVDQLAGYMKEKGYTDLSIDAPFESLSTYHYRKAGDIFALQNESSYETFKGKVSLPTGADLLVYDGMADRFESISQTKEDTDKGSRTVVELELAPAESIVLVDRAAAEEISAVLGTNLHDAARPAHQSFTDQLAGLDEIDLSTGWEVTKVRSIDYPAFPEEVHKEALEPVSKEAPDFSGVIRYRKKISLDKAPEKAFFKADQVYEVMKVLVNGKEAGFRLNPPYQVELTGCLQAGENEISVEVATTPAREQDKFPRPPFDFDYEAVEATGMFGKVSLCTR